MATLSCALLACGGAPFSALAEAAGTNGSLDGSTDGAAPKSGSGGSGGSEAGAELDSAPPSDASALADAVSAPDGSGADGGDAASKDAGTCPDVLGRYGSIVATGLGCGDINTSAPQCIASSSAPCGASFVSKVSGVGAGAVNGAANLQSDGHFSGAALVFGTIQRTGCSGTWDPQTSTMSITCGGVGGSAGCVVSMVRSGTCP